MIYLDDALKPGQKVRVVRTVDIAFDVDIANFLADSGDPDITVEQLQDDIENNFTVSDILDEWNDAEITDIAVTVTEIN